MRRLFKSENIDPAALKKVESYFPEVIQEIEQLVQEHEWVVVGMAQNPFVTKARKRLSEKNIHFQYIEHGSYFSKWKPRLAIKMWTGWPTFPQIFHRGKLIGGYTDLVKYLPQI